MILRIDFLQFYAIFEVDNFYGIIFMIIRALQKDKNHYKPLLSCAADLVKNLAETELNTNFMQDEFIDFSNYLFVLPTQEAARIFREKITETFEHCGGVLSLKTVLPEYFLYSKVEGKTSISQIQAMELWYQAISDFKPNNDHGIFKNHVWEKNSDNITWKLGVCKNFQHLRKDVALEKALSCQEFYNKFKDISLL